MGGSSNYSYTTPINFTVSSWGVDIAITTSSITQYNPQNLTGFNYYIESSPSLTSNSIIYILTINNDLSWSSIDMGYLICSRSDLAAGSFEAPVSSWIPATANIYNVYQSVARTLPLNSYYVAAFVSGFSTSGISFEITINNKAYDVNKKSVAISFYCTGNPAVLTISISYVIYPVTHPTFSIYYELLPQVSDSPY
jgi:hypothetical protein